MGRYRRLSYAMTSNQVPLVTFLLGFLVSIETVTCVTIAEGHELENSKLQIVATRYCDFSTADRIYNITDLLLCMDELASTAVAHIRNIRSPDVSDLPLVSSRRAQYPYPQYQPLSYNYPPRPETNYQSYYGGRPSFYYPGTTGFQGDNSGYYDGPNRYPLTAGTPFGFPGGSGAGLLEALTSISQYDDLKCVSRLLCEVATGVTPGKTDYNRGFGDSGGNSLIRLLTAFDAGGSSALLKFGKSALTGLTSRGNPSACYREYPKCPRNNADLVDYLNNHNGGFFRFFGNNRGPASQHIDHGNHYYRGATSREHEPRPTQPVPGADRTGTGELKFDTSSSSIARDSFKNFFTVRGESNESNKFVFPQEPSQEEQSLNRVSKSLNSHSESDNGYQNPSFFPQDRKDRKTNMVYVPNSGVPTPWSQPRSSRTTVPPKGRLYLPDDPSNETLSSFTFPDGQKVRINVAFSKLFSEGYKKALRRSFANDHGPQPVNFEGFSMVNLAELYPNDRNRLDLQVVHPCDMICHDSKLTPVQFNQILLHSGSLSTLMAPDQPILDLSTPLPCEVMCIDRRGERRRLSTTLNRVLRNSYDRANQPDFAGLQDYLENQEFQWLGRQQRRRNLHNREIAVPNVRQFAFNKNVNQPSRSIDVNKHRMPVSQDRPDHRQMDSDRRVTRQPESQLHVSKPRDTGNYENTLNGVNVNDKATSVLEGPMIVGGGPMPLFGPPMPFVGISEMSQDGPSFFPDRTSGPMGLAMPSMGGLPMQPVGGIVQSFGMMPMFPGMMPMMDPLSAGLPPMTSPVFPPPTVECSSPDCSPGSPARALVMCADVLYFVPYEIIRTMPVCAVWLESEASSESGNHESQRHPSPASSATLPSSTNLPLRSEITPRPEDFHVTPITTTHKFRQPEGEDYPQISCLEGESWNLDAHECVPIKYDKDVETDYTHLPGSPWSGVTRKPIKTHKLKKRKKLVIITDKGNITYIKAA